MLFEVVTQSIRAVFSYARTRGPNILIIQDVYINYPRCKHFLSMQYYIIKNHIMSTPNAYKYKMISEEQDGKEVIDIRRRRIWFRR